MEEKDILEKIEENKKLPQEVKKQILNKIFECAISAIIVYIYFIFLKLGEKNIHRNIYLTDLQVFATSLAILAVILFEKSYSKKDKKRMIIGIEILLLAINTILVQYIILYLTPKYTILIPGFAIIYNVYFVLKALALIHNEKEQYRLSLSDIKEIVKKQPKH